MGGNFEKKKQERAWFEVFGSVVLSFALVIALAFLLSLAEEIFSAKVAAAASLKGYEALPIIISGGGKLTMAPGESQSVFISFQNIGSSLWQNGGAHFVSVYTFEPKYRISAFTDASWYKNNQPTKISENEVKVNSVGSFSFILKAPTVVGTYKETFALAAEDKAWIPGGQFSFTITVVEKKSDTDNINTSVSGYSAVLLIKSAKKTIQAKGGEIVTFTAGLKNTGTKAWVSRSIKLPDVLAASSTNHKDSSWIDAKTAIIKTDGSVVPGAIDLITFKFKAPAKRGSYVVKFALAADEVGSIPGGEIEIPIEVTSDAAEVLEDEEVAGSDEVEDLIDEPMLRVGVLIVDEETDDEVVVTCDSDFVLKDSNGALLAEVDQGDEVEAFYKKGKYWFDRGQGLESSSFYLRFVPDDENAVCEVTNFDRRESRSAANADNQFRNILELRYNDYKDRVWLINELPMEYYLRGLAETSNLSNLDFQKALITAARTYALYHFERATKHAKEFFHVDAYADQVYNGYGQEERTPRLTQAVEETAGYVVAYENKTAITPYFSRSDGRTRDWSEVWGGSVPWCLSVKTPHDVGKKLWGHGVGMSASEALAMGNDGTDWQEILKYFYTGIEVERKWK